MVWLGCIKGALIAYVSALLAVKMAGMIFGSIDGEHSFILVVVLVVCASVVAIFRAMYFFVGGVEYAESIVAAPFAIVCTYFGVIDGVRLVVFEH
jgi:hypothetical protein